MKITRGVWGLGEASSMVHGNASLEIAASAFTPMLLGADPLQTRVLQDRLFHQHITLGPEGRTRAPWPPSTSRCGTPIRTIRPSTTDRATSRTSSSRRRYAR
jgi:hypothetical protein